MDDTEPDACPPYLNHMEVIYRLLRHGDRPTLEAEAGKLPMLGTEAPRALLLRHGEGYALYCPVNVEFSPRSIVTVW